MGKPPLLVNPKSTIKPTNGLAFSLYLHIPNPDEPEPNRETASSLAGESTVIAPGPLGREIFVILYKILRLRD